MAHVEFTRRAALDLAEIEEYSIEGWGERVASKYLDAFNQAALVAIFGEKLVLFELQLDQLCS